MACVKCGYTSSRGDKVINRLSHERENIIVLGKEEQKIRTLPKTKADCPKCSNHEAFYWLGQTRGADESFTQIFRCSNCGANWRENKQTQCLKNLYIGKESFRGRGENSVGGGSF